MSIATDRFDKLRVLADDYRTGDVYQEVRWWQGTCRKLLVDYERDIELKGKDTPTP